MPWLPCRVQPPCFFTSKHTMFCTILHLLACREMEARAPRQCRAWVGFSVQMAHRITAGMLY